MFQTLSSDLNFIKNESNKCFGLESQILKFIFFEFRVRNELQFDVHFPSDYICLDGLHIILETVINASISVCELLVVSVSMNEFVEEDLILEN